MSSVFQDVLVTNPLPVFFQVGGKEFITRSSFCFVLLATGVCKPDPEGHAVASDLMVKVSCHNIKNLMSYNF